MRRAYYLLAGLLAGLSHAAPAQTIIDPARATAARDSLFQLCAATRTELFQQTSFVLKAPRQGQRRQIIRGYSLADNPEKLSKTRRRRIRLWKQRRVVLRNGQVKERYVARLNGRAVLQERRRNGVVQWLQLSRPQLLARAYWQAPLYYMGTYSYTGYLVWNARKYALPVTYSGN